MIKTYKALKFWQSAREVSLQIAHLIKFFPKEKVAWIISDQVIRSSFSVGANITEGLGKFRGKEYSRFIRMALGSANETEYWLELTADLYPKAAEKIKNILRKNTETIKMLVATLNSLNKKFQ